MASTGLWPLHRFTWPLPTPCLWAPPPPPEEWPPGPRGPKDLVNTGHAVQSQTLPRVRPSVRPSQFPYFTLLSLVTKTNRLFKNYLINSYVLWVSHPSPLRSSSPQDRAASGGLTASPAGTALLRPQIRDTCREPSRF